MGRRGSFRLPPLSTKREVFMKLNEIILGIKTYIRNEITTLDWKMAFAEPLIFRGVDNFIKKNGKMLSYLMDENGDIGDIDILRKEYMEKINKQGTINLVGIKLNAQDVSKMFDYIMMNQPQGN
jgi:hypothetical protein